MLSLGKNKIKVLLLEGIHSKAVEVLNDHGYYNIKHIKSALEEKDLIHEIQDAYMLGIRSRSMITPKVLEAAKKLIVIGCFCIGTNQVDLGSATINGVPVFNAPHSNTRSVAEFVIGLTIMLLRDAFYKSSEAHKGTWLKSSKGSYEVRGKTIGIIGYGHIGSQVSILAEALGMSVLYYDIQTKLPLGNAKQLDSLSKLLKQSDIVTLHVPENASTYHLIAEKELSSMKTDALLINTSRGSVINIDAITQALKDKKIKGAAIDVFPNEPQGSDQVFKSPLHDLRNVILTPHIGGSTIEAQENIGIEVAKKLIYFSDRGSSEGSVNFPSLSLSPHENTHRILHIHHNVPGMLQKINTIIAEENINVLGQHLLTNEKIGYTVIDISKDTSEKLLKALKQAPGTIRSRVLY